MQNHMQAQRVRSRVENSTIKAIMMIIIIVSLVNSNNFMKSRWYRVDTVVTAPSMPSLFHFVVTMLNLFCPLFDKAFWLRYVPNTLYQVKPNQQIKNCPKITTRSYVPNTKYVPNTLYQVKNKQTNLQIKNYAPPPPPKKKNHNNVMAQVISNDQKPKNVNAELSEKDTSTVTSYNI